MDTRTVLVGMVNPHSADPIHALAPYPQGVAGQRLFDMLAAVRPDTFRGTYMRGFDRRNVLVGRDWSLRAAREVAPELWRSLGGRRVVLLGRAVLDALRLPQTTPLVWQRPEASLLSEPGPAQWCYVPHPSGLNHWYNDEICRVVTGLRLEEELERFLACQDPSLVA